jgi:ATP:corrinoid adenosyltransferase
MSKFDTFKAITGCEFKEVLTKKEKVLKILNSESFKKTLKKCSPLFKLIFLKGFGLDREFLNNPLLNELLSADEEDVDSLIERALEASASEDNGEVEGEPENDTQELEESGVDDSDSDLGEEQSITDATEDIMVMNDLEDAQTLDCVLEDFDGQNIVFSNETINFFVSSQVNALWQSVYNKTNNFSIEDFKIENFNDSIFDQTQKVFLEEYSLVNKVKTSSDYKHKYQPSDMQRLTSVRLMRDGYLGNWSGTGAGKTLSALVFSGVINAEITFIVALNSTINGWVSEIKEAYPYTSNVIVSNLNEEIKTQKGKKNFIILNYEKFQQQEKSVEFVNGIVKNIKVDFFVLDEVHSIKQEVCWINIPILFNNISQLVVFR